MQINDSSDQNLSQTEKDFHEAARQVGKTPEEFRVYLKGLVDGPFLGRPRGCVSHRRLYDTTSEAPKRPLTDGEREHIKGCETCGDEFALFSLLRKNDSPAAS